MTVEIELKHVVGIGSKQRASSFPKVVVLSKLSVLLYPDIFGQMTTLIFIWFWVVFLEGGWASLLIKRIPTSDPSTSANSSKESFFINHQIQSDQVFSARWILFLIFIWFLNRYFLMVDGQVYLINRVDLSLHVYNIKNRNEGHNLPYQSDGSNNGYKIHSRLEGNGATMLLRSTG